MITLVAIMSKNRVIAKDGRIPWDIKEDKARFYNLTINKTVVMGRKTFESIGSPLKDRRNVVVSRDFAAAGVETFSDLKTALNSAEDVVVIGGAEVYKQTINLANKLELTIVDEIIDGDKFFPDFNDWKELSRIKKDNYCFISLGR